MRSPRVCLLLLLALLCGLDLFVAFRRSGIPLALDGPVTEVELRREKHPGVDDVYLLRIGRVRVHLDAHVGRRLRVGEVVQKEAWERTLHARHGAIALRPSPDVRGMLWVLPAMLLLGAWMLRRPARPQST